MKRAEARMDEAGACAHRIEEEHISSDALHEEQLKAVEAQIAELRENLKIFLEEAIKKYLASEEFQDELTDCKANGFSEGFTECHRQIHKLYPDLDISELKEVYNDGRDD